MRYAIALFATSIGTMAARTSVLLALAVISSGIQAAPQIESIAGSPQSVELYSIFTVDFQVSTAASNVYWPYDTDPPAPIPAGVGVTVDGLFSKDNWATTLTVPAFYYQDYEPISTSVRTHMRPIGTGRWRIRFAPTETGEWQYKIRVTDSTGTTVAPDGTALSFSSVSGSGHGFVGVSARDSRYFELSDGSTLMAIGVNGGLSATFPTLDAKIQAFGTNGIRLLRTWLNYRGGLPVFGDPSMGTYWAVGKVTSTVGGYKPGDRFALTILPTKYAYQPVYLTAGVTYRLKCYAKSVGLAGGDAFAGIGPYGTYVKAAQLSGDSDWTAYSVDYTPSKTDAYYVMLNAEACTDGAAYFDEISLKSTSDGGVTWSEDLLAQGDLDTQNYMNQMEAFRVDRIFADAKQHGVYIKAVVSEKGDPTLGTLDAEGNVVTRADDNFYASDSHPSRWQQKTWWRYMTARWGAYTSLHSWELCNEGDPFNGNHYNAANALADYVHSVYPRRILCTTSLWHSLPMDFWKTSSCDYIDVHEYFGTWVPDTGSYGNRYYSWSDGNKVPWESARAYTTLDSSVYHSGPRSIRIDSKVLQADESLGYVGDYPEYHIGVDPTHRYTLRFTAKGQNVHNPGGGLSWTRPGVNIVWSRAYHANDFVSQQCYNAELNTYDWKTFMYAGIAPPANANTANIAPQSVGSLTDTGTFWVDDVSFVDETTGREMLLGGNFDNERIDYDTALATRRYGLLFGSYGARCGKPGIWGETGVRGPDLYGTPYRGTVYGSFQEEHPQLTDDTEGIWLRKMLWGHLGPGNPNMLYWWTSRIQANNLWPLFKAFQVFVDGIPLSNGNYTDADAQTSVPALRAWGQKNLVNNCAHLWIDNAPYTWKAVVDHNYSPEAWSSAVTYAKDSTCGSGSPVHIYKSLQAGNKNHAVTETEWWQDTGVFSSANNPALPPSVTGSVTLAGLRDGQYKAEWWNTSTGTITRSETVQCSSGDIVLSVESLQSDLACKIYPVPPKIDLRILLPSAQVEPGQEITVTVEYTNSGDSDATNATVSARVPAEMDYVAGSAEASGGAWNSATGYISWTIASLPAHQSGAKTFKARVR